MEKNQNKNNENTSSSPNVNQNQGNEPMNQNLIPKNETVVEPTKVSSQDEKGKSEKQGEQDVKEEKKDKESDRKEEIKVDKTREDSKEKKSTWKNVKPKVVAPYVSAKKSNSYSSNLIPTPVPSPVPFLLPVPTSLSSISSLTQISSSLSSYRDSPPHRSGHSAVIYKSSMFIFGGEDDREKLSNELWEYDIEKNEWRRIESDGSPPPRSGHSAVVYKSFMYVFGGDGGDKRLNDLYQFSFENYNWTKIVPNSSATVPPPRCKHSCIVMDDMLVIYGGWDWEQMFYDIHLFDLNSNEWKKWIYFNQNGNQQRIIGRIWHTAIYRPVSNDEKDIKSESGMYIFGGEDLGHALYNDLYLLSHDLKTFDKVYCEAIYPPSRNAHASTYYGACDSLIVVGGYGGEMTVHNDIFQYSFRFRKWRRIHLESPTSIHSHSETPHPRYGHSIVLYNDKFYVMGGKTSQLQTLNDLYEIQIDQDMKWAEYHSSAHHAPTTQRDEDWICTECTMANGSSLNLCHMCKSPRYHNSASHSAVSLHSPSPSDRALVPYVEPTSIVNPQQQQQQAQSPTPQQEQHDQRNASLQQLPNQAPQQQQGSTNEKSAKPKKIPWWDCEWCTYKNPPHLPYCHICHVSKTVLEPSY